VRLSKNGQARRVLLNTTARAALMDLLTRRLHPTDPDELVCRGAYRTVSRELVRAVQAAQPTLRSASRAEEAARLDGVTWHALRHTCASRLVASGVDLRAVQELGGWRTLSMVCCRAILRLPSRRSCDARSGQPQTVSNVGRASSRQRGFLDVRSETRK
jgi:site-specific recombinase XerD